MRVLICAAFALTLPAQVSAPVSQPQWLTELQSIQQKMYQAAAGSLDGKVEQAWRAALQMQQHPQFLFAAQMTSNFYQSQGYDLKAEQVLRQALAAVPEADVRMRRHVILQLASHFENTRQLVKALAIREEMEKEPRPPASVGHVPPRTYELTALARLYEQMGEFEEAETAWKEAAAQPPGYGSGLRNQLAGFYARRGRYPEAEEIYKAALADAAQSSSPSEWSGAAEGYIGFLSQHDARPDSGL